MPHAARAFPEKRPAHHPAASQRDGLPRVEIPEAVMRSGTMCGRLGKPVVDQTSGISHDIGGAI
ncbi:MAG: hypothetical protein ABJA86_12375, partial [Nocardioidaceae bacterium]